HSQSAAMGWLSRERSIRAAPLATIANGWATPAAVQSAPANQEHFFALGCAQRSHAPASASEPTQQAENASTLEFPQTAFWAWDPSYLNCQVSPPRTASPLSFSLAQIPLPCPALKRAPLSRKS